MRGRLIYALVTAARKGCFCNRLSVLLTRHDNGEAKFWLDPIRLERSRGFRRKEINRVRELIEEHREQLLESWNEFFRG